MVRPKLWGSGVEWQHVMKWMKYEIEMLVKQDENITRKITTCI